MLSVAVLVLLRVEHYYRTPAYKAWAQWVNGNGGINGHKVNLINKDDSFNPGTSLTEVKTMVQEDHAIAIVDGSDVDASWADYVKQENVPVIGAESSSEPFFTNSDFYAEGQTEDQLFASIVGAAKKVKAKNMALFYCAEAATCQEGVAPSRPPEPPRVSRWSTTYPSRRQHPTIRRSAWPPGRPAPSLSSSLTRSRLSER